MNTVLLRTTALSLFGLRLIPQGASGGAVTTERVGGLSPEERVTWRVSDPVTPRMTRRSLEFSVAMSG